MDIFFNIDPLGMEGLGATLTSLIRNCSDPKQLKLHFLCSDIKEEDKSNVNSLLEHEQFTGTITFHHFDAKEEFGHLRSLHGNWTPYGRLLIPSLLDAGTAIYLDADLIINTNILDLKCTDFQGYHLAAIPGGNIGHSLESSFYVYTLLIDESAPSFNSGVLIFNIDEWHKNNITARVNEIATRHPQELYSCDQALLNAVSRGHFAQLPKEFNKAYYPNDRFNYDGFRGILHFIGSPKPWDIGAKLVHNGYNTWNSYHTPVWKEKYSGFNRKKIQRLWHIRRSYLRHMRDRLLGK